MLHSLYCVCSWWWDASNKKDQTSQTILTLFVTLFIVGWFLWMTKKSRKVTQPLPPGPRGLPLVGYLPFLGTNLHKVFTDLASVYGPVYKLWLGNKLCIVISSPSLVKEISCHQDANFANRDSPIIASVITYGGNDIVFAPHGNEWRKMRKVLVREVQSKSTMDAYYPLRRREVRKGVKYLFSKINTPVDIGDFAFLTVSNVIRSILLGLTLVEKEEEAGDVAADFATEFRKVVYEQTVIFGERNVSDLFPILSWFDIQGLKKRALKVFRCHDQMLNSIIEIYMNLVKANDGTRKIEQTCLLQHLLDLKEQGDGAQSLTMPQIKALLLDVTVGGVETTSTALEWVMAELMQHPKIMKKVQKELDQVVGINKTVEELHLPQLQYLSAVVKETFRLHPTLPLLIPRCPSESCIVGGYTIPKGSMVFLNVWAMHRDPKLWESPLLFEPERFLNDYTYDFYGNSFQYFPFGSGRRICAGIPLAEKMLMFGLASFLHSFDWKLCYGQEVDLDGKFGMVVKKAKPLVIIPTPRLFNMELYA